jgi:hypothetical protein
LGATIGDLQVRLAQPFNAGISNMMPLPLIDEGGIEIPPGYAWAGRFSA